MEASCYSVVVSRSVGDLFSAVLVAAVSLMANKNSASFAVLALFLYVTTFGFLQLSLSHILVIVLRQISLFRPYGFESAFSLRKLVACLVVLWLLSIFYAAAFAPLTTVILDPRKAEGVCSYFSCQRPLIIIAIALVAFLMATVLLFYAAVAYKLYNTSVQEKLHNEPNITKKKLKHFMGFGAHIVLYVLICSLLLAGAIIIQNNIWLFHKVQVAETCSLIEYLNTMIRLETIAGGAVLLWMVRIVADVAVLWVSEYRRLLPWISRNEPRILPNNQQIVTRSDSLRWRRQFPATFNCPVYTLERPQNKWDYKN
ncbi:unnamed protein product, partial [Mesorhabditis belari]|uniref:G-protein coupled receptors family 1 profile domain-containing protein n=1 Tax=Mesorhabditis belari TaxID=2138241 RepID=A0AAF3FMF4_9BILA